MKPPPSLILASSSPTRIVMLRNAGLEFTSSRPSTDETSLKRDNPELPPEQLALLLATAKSRNVSALHPRALTVGADQILSCEGQKFDKPQNLDEARAQLVYLRNKTHQLFSAVSCCSADTVQWRHVSTAHLTMRDLSTRFIDAYCTTLGDDLTTSVGAYKLEGRGIQLFERIEGDYFTILGMPLLPLLAFLRTKHILPT